MHGIKMDWPQYFQVMISTSDLKFLIAHLVSLVAMGGFKFPRIMIGNPVFKLSICGEEYHKDSINSKIQLSK